MECIEIYFVIKDFFAKIIFLSLIKNFAKICMFVQFSFFITNI